MCVCVCIYIVTCRPISRQRPKHAHTTIEPNQKRRFLFGLHISIARQRSSKHIFLTTEDGVFRWVRAEELS
jgi:hypothetical protein